MEKEDEYAYLNRPGFTTEIFKLEVRGLPKYYGMSVNIKRKFHPSFFRISD